MTDRTGLYIMMVATMLSSCSTHFRTVDMEKKINGLEEKMEDAKLLRKKMVKSSMYLMVKEHI